VPTSQIEGRMEVQSEGGLEFRLKFRETKRRRVG
jgi:two-component sensor histidine kinase